jgi:hypothetical protein
MPCKFFERNLSSSTIRQMSAGVIKTGFATLHHEPSARRQIVTGPKIRAPLSRALGLDRGCGALVFCEFDRRCPSNWNLRGGSRVYSANTSIMENSIGKAIILWLLGVPVVVIVLLAVTYVI